MRSLPFAAFSLIALVAAVPALAADLDAASRIEAVTVYPDAAAVTRRAEADLPAGATMLVFRDLPASIDPNSLRITGEGPQGLVLGSVEVRRTPADPHAASEIEAKIKALRAERDKVGAAIAALEGKRGMMQRFAETGPDKLGPKEAALDVSQWGAAWEAVGQGLARVNEDLRQAGIEATRLDDEIRALEAARQRPGSLPGRQPRRDVTVALEAGQAGKARFALSYRVAGAGWRPVYDARLDTHAEAGKPALELVRRAAVTQRSGEDWQDVALTVSTTRARRGTAAPDVQPERLAFQESPIVMRQTAPVAQAFRKEARDAASASAPAPAQAPAMEEAREREATLDAGVFQASFTVPGRVSIAGDGSARNVRLSTLKPDAVLAWSSAPALDPAAYLEARFVLEEEAPLLPGEVSIFRDGDYVGRGRLPMVAPGAQVKLGFGADDKVAVVRVPVKRQESEPSWLSSTRTELRDFRTSVKNLHTFPVKVTITDRIPISENSAIVVEQLSQTTAPTVKQVEDKRGVMAWTLDLKPGDTRDIRLAYQMKWPADRPVVFQPAPVTPLPR